ncbi:MAG: hypothetical protein ACR2MW_02975 [Chthoniobacterales bacterium]
MSALWRWKLISGFLLVFVAGLILGTFLGAQVARNRRLDHAKHSVLSEKVRRRMQARLDLTPAQMKQAAPIFEQTAWKLDAIREETAEQVYVTFTAADHALAPQLSLEQRATMQKLEAKHKNSKPEEIPAGQP